MTEDSDLVVDEAGLETLCAGYADALDDVEARRLAAALRGMMDHVQRPRPVAATPQVAIANLVDVASALRPFYSTAIVVKTLIPALTARLRVDGYTGPLPLPSPSAGAALARSLVELAEQCAGRGVAPETVSRNWPEVAPDVVDLIIDFAKRHRGYGPLAWEGHGLRPHDIAVSLGLVGVSSRTPPSPEATVGASAAPAWGPLELCLQISEGGILLTRRAFFETVVPNIASVATSKECKPGDVLFATFGEIERDLLDPATLQSRRKAYAHDTEYLGRHSLQADAVDGLPWPS